MSQSKHNRTARNTLVIEGLLSLSCLFTLLWLIANTSANTSDTRYFSRLCPGWSLFVTTASVTLVSCLAVAISVRRSIVGLAGSVFKDDPLLHSKTESIKQTFSQLTFWGLVICYATFMVNVAFFHNGLGDWIAGWLEASGRDAHVALTTPYPHAANFDDWVRGTMVVQSFVSAPDLHALVKSLLSLAFIVLPWRRVTQVAALLTSFVERAAPAKGRNVLDALIEAMNARAFVIKIMEPRPRLMNVLRSLHWLLICYFGLFWLFGFCPGWLGMNINNFLSFAVRDANYVYFDMHILRPFLASIISLYAVVPVAVMTSVFLPPRKPSQLTVTDDAILFSESYLLPLNFCLLRSLDEVDSVTLKTNPRNEHHSLLKIVFRSGGTFKCRLDQLERRELLQLLAVLDQGANCCHMDDQVLELTKTLAQQEGANKYGLDASATANGASKFKSTVYVPHAAGDKLQDGRFRIVKQIASNAVTSVYLSRNKDNNKRCILKQFYAPAGSESTKAALRELRRECELLSTIDHPSLAKMQQTFEDGDSFYVVMEYCQGETLQALVARSGQQPEELVLAWATQIAETMSCLHSVEPPVLHRDLRPNNFLLEKSGCVRFIDFGASRQYLESSLGGFTGQQSYVAAEQLRGQASLKSDIYSFGCTLSYLLTGNVPAALQPSDLSDADILVSPWMIEMIRACTDFDEGTRPDSFSKILTILRHEVSKPLSLAQRRDPSRSVPEGAIFDQSLHDQHEEQRFFEMLNIAAGNSQSQPEILLTSLASSGESISLNEVEKQTVFGAKVNL